MHGKAPQSDALVKGILIAVAAVAVAFFLFQAISQKPAQITPTPFAATATPSPIPTPAFVEVTGLEVAQSAVKFLNEMRKSDGTYVYSIDCDSSGCSKKSHLEGYPQSNAWAALAHVGLYRATNDKAHLDAAVREVEKEIEICSNVSSVAFGSTKTCLWALVQPFEVYKETKDEALKKFIVQQGILLLSSSPPEQNGSGMIQGISAREFAIVFSLAGDEVFLKRALGHMDAANKALDFENRAVYFDNATGFAARTDECWVKLAELELYGVTKNESFLKSAQSFFDKAKFGDLSNGRAENFDISTMLHPCVESLAMLEKFTGKKSYGEEAGALAQLLAGNFFDSKYSKIYDGEGAFVVAPCRQESGGQVCLQSNSKPVTDNAYNAFLFSTLDSSRKYKIYSIPVVYGQGASRAVSLGSIEPSVQSLAQNVSHYPSKLINNLLVQKKWGSDNVLLITYTLPEGKTLANPVLKVNGETVGNYAARPATNYAENWTITSYEFEYNRAGPGNYDLVLTADGVQSSTTFVWELKGDFFQ